MKINNVYIGNNLDILKTFPDNSIDSVVTDPPYGLGKEPNAVEVLQSWIEKGYHEVKGKGFMGKEWDAFVPQPNFWKEIYRVLKPGGYVLSFAGTRTYDWMVMAIRLAGFEIRDQIAWVYGSGFPKSMDVSKAIDKSMGAEREVVGSKYVKDFSNHKGSMMSKTTTEKYETHGTDVDITAPSTDQAKQWEGWGTALKPALEPIVMARKPLEGTVAQNVLKYGVGGINIDECRVPTEEEDIKNLYRKPTEYEDKDPVASMNASKVRGSVNEDYKKGRFPANVIHDGSEEVEALFPQTQSGLMTPNHTRTTDGSPNGIYGKFDVNYPLGETYGDSGSASRFFYVAKASQEERNFGLYDFEEKFTASAEFRPNHMEKAIEGESGNPYGRWQPKKNIHPTVKPIELMRYLVRMITPPNGICLDPYLGSGTTAIACEMEKFSWIGIELMPEYAEIAKARIDAVKDYESTLDTKTFIKESIKEDKKEKLGIQSIFDFMED